MTCSTIYCNNEKFDNFNKCTLHCSNDDINEKNRSAHKLRFNADFHDYIFQKLEKSNSEKEYDSQKKNTRNKKILSDAKKVDWTEFDEAVLYKKNDFFELIKDEEITFTGINFPDYAIHYLNGNIRILESLGKVVFEECDFRNFWESGSKNLFYEDCTFHKYLDIKIYEEYSSDEEIVYIKRSNKKEYICKRCVFEENVSIEGQGLSHTDTSYIPCEVFLDYQFMGNIDLKNVKVGGTFISVSKVFKGLEKIKSKEQHEELISKYKKIYKFKDITIIDSEFDDSFKINGLDVDYLNDNRAKYEDSIGDLIYEFGDISKINKISIKDSKFNKKFELKNTKVEGLDLNNSNIEGIFDTYKSSFIKAKFRKSIFKDFAAFEYVVFGDGKKENITDFIYTTFKDFSNFRNTKFQSGLNFSSANIKQEPNFLNAYVSMCGTDRETFRIIKNSFDDVGNKIEANRFFIKEMQSYRKEIYSDTKEDVSFWDKIIYSLNNNISSFGQSYIRPTRLLFLSMILYSLLLYKHKLFFSENQYLISIDFLCIDKISNRIFELLNDSAENLLPFSRFLVKKDGMEFISLLFYIWFAILIWQIVVAVKRHTQR